MEFSGIYVDQEFNLNFISHYSEVHQQLEDGYREKLFNQEQFRSLQQEITETYYSEFFLQEIDLDTNLISIV